ncbi:hypothetical protein [Yinghuangia sp. YIM S09857]|uniref:hypothetical protein n=1 Tax=Yinghuangia sp. YIM S09857 TaxID=3436929 RepID=UPI003F53B647
MITVRVSYTAAAHTALSDIYGNTACPPRTLASAQLRVLGDLATPAARFRAAAYLDQPTLLARSGRQSASRTMIDAALGRTPTVDTSSTAPGAIAVLHLAEDPDAPGRSDAGWRYLFRQLLRDLGEDRWPITHPWLLVRTCIDVRLIVNTELPYHDLDSAHALISTAHRFLARAYPHR